MKNLDLLIASLFLLLGIGGSLWAYNEIDSAENLGVTLFEDFLRIGENGFNVRSSELCVGQVELSIEKTESITLRGKGVLRLRTDSESSDLVASFHAVFNPLKQFSGGEGTLRFGAVEIRIKAEDVSPINFSVQVRGLEKEYSYAHSFQGPILLDEYRQGFIRIEYPFPVQLSSTPAGGWIEQLRRLLNLQVETWEGSPVRCVADQLYPLDLRALIQNMNQIQKFFPKTIEQHD